MPFSIPYHGVVLTTNTADEAVDLADAIRRRAVPKATVAVDLVAEGVIKPLVPPDKGAQIAQAEMALEVAPTVGAIETTLAPAAPVRRDRLEMSLEFLEAIRDAQYKGGLETNEVIRILRIHHPKGIGGRSALINEQLERVGYPDPTEVYTNPKTPVGRFWLGGPKLEAAIQQLFAAKVLFVTGRAPAAS